MEEKCVCFLDLTNNTMTDYQLEYNLLYEKQQQLIQEAKVFIRDNWQQVRDWKSLSLSVQNGSTGYSGNPRQSGRYSPQPPALSSTSAVWNRLSLRGYCGVAENVEVVLDTSDWDLSLTITTTQGETLAWFWIDNQAVIDLAAYIQQQLHSQQQPL